MSQYRDEEAIEQAQREAHENEDCEGVPFCAYCLDDEEQMSRDIDELADHVNKEQALTILDKIECAIRAYHSALDNRQHGGIAQDCAMREIEKILNMPWTK